MPQTKGPASKHHTHTKLVILTGVKDLLLPFSVLRNWGGLLTHSSLGHFHKRRVERRCPADVRKPFAGENVDVPAIGV
jgi:hypothetical protein